MKSNWTYYHNSLLPMKNFLCVTLLKRNLVKFLTPSLETKKKNFYIFPKKILLYPWDDY